MLDIGKILKENRENAKLTQSELAKKTGIKQQNISRWENNTHTPNIMDYITLADYFNVSIDYLVGRENDYGLVEVKNDLTVKEQELLNYFRVLSPFEQGELVGAARAMAKRSAV